VTGNDERELRELQARAYGRNADIHLDPIALRRLHELESRGDDDTPSAVVEDDGGVTADEDVAEADTTAPDSPPADEPAAPAPARFWRRPGLLIAAAVVAVAAVFGSGFLLGRTGPGGPVPSGSTRVARLPIDPGYKPPQAIHSGDAAAGKVEGFREYSGLRAVVGALLGAPSGQTCILVYAPAATSESITGIAPGAVWSGCGAGPFPAATQFSVTTQLPTATRAALSGKRALQFVYDKARNEVDVYAAR
jgi:hypothetical protein